MSRAFCKRTSLLTLLCMQRQIAVPVLGGRQAALATVSELPYCHKVDLCGKGPAASHVHQLLQL